MTQCQVRPYYLQDYQLRPLAGFHWRGFGDIKCLERDARGVQGHAPGKFWKCQCSLMTFPAFWVHYYTILVDDLWHKLCNFLSKYLVSIYFSQSTLLTSFRAVMGGFKILGGTGEEIGYGEEQTTRIFSLIFLSFVEILAMIVDLWNVSKRQTLQISG